MKHVNLNIIKSLFSYTIPELSELLGLQQATIYRWINNEGLEKIDSLQPTMIFGQCLINFLKHRQSKDKRALAPYELWCCRCRKPRVPIQETVQIMETKKANLFKGVCPVSGTKMNRIVSRAQAYVLSELLASDTPFSRLTEHESALVNQKIEEWNVAPQYCCENERIKWKYLKYERLANGKSQKSIDKIVRAIHYYEEFTDYDVLEKFNSSEAELFRKHLLDQKNENGEPLSLFTISFVLRALQNFFRWLSVQPGYKSKIDPLDIDFLNLSAKERQKTQRKAPKKYPNMDHIRKVLFSTQPNSYIEYRNQAIIAFLACTGVRAGALIGLKLKHLDVERKVLFQDPKEVDTKFGKSIVTKLLPVGDDIHQIVINWVEILKTGEGFDDNCPLFPRSMVKHVGNFTIERDILSRQHYKSPSTINRLVKAEFKRVGLHPYPPHRFRDMISELGRKLCRNMEDYMAWGANLGHKNPITTFSVYGTLSPEHQIEVLERLEQTSENTIENKDIEAIAIAVAKEIGTRFK